MYSLGNKKLHLLVEFRKYYKVCRSTTILPISGNLLWAQYNLSILSWALIRQGLRTIENKGELRTSLWRSGMTAVISRLLQGIPWDRFGSFQPSREDFPGSTSPFDKLRGRFLSFFHPHLSNLPTSSINDIFMSSRKTPFSILLNILMKLYFVLEIVWSWKGLRV